MTGKQLRDYPLFFVGGDEWRSNVDGDFVRVVEATGPVYLSFDGGPWVKREVGQAQEGSFSTLAVKSLVPQNVRLSAGYGRLTDNRQDVTVNITSALDPGNSILNAGDVTVGAGLTVQIVAGNVARKDIILQAANSNDPGIYPRIGNAALTAASGIELAAGVGLPPWETQAAIYCHNPGAAAIKILYVENQRI